MELEKMFPIVLTALVAVCYSNSLWCDLVFDDIAAIRDNRDLRPHTPIYNIFQNDFWGTPIRKVSQIFNLFSIFTKLRKLRAHFISVQQV